MSDSSARQPNQWRYILVWAGVVLLTLAAHVRSLKGEFVLYDDNTHIVGNTAIRALTLENLRVMFTGFIANLYCPLTWLSFAVDYQVWELNPLGYHLTNLLLHLANTVLVVFLVEKLLRQLNPQATLIALLAGAIFGVHPLRVDSVAWITERKDVLFGFFYLLGLLAYLHWTTTRKSAAFWGCFACFVASVLSKSAGVTFPAVLLIVDVFWARRRAWVEKLPFFIVSAIVAGQTVLAQSHVITSLGETPVVQRVGLVGYCALFYIGKFFWPFQLTPIYPDFNVMDWTNSIALIYAVALAVVTILIVCLRRRAPVLVPAWLFYLVTLSPTIGLAPVGIHVVANYYSYIPLLGVALAVSVGVVTVVQRFPTIRPAMLGATVSVLVAWTVLSDRYGAVWSNTETLFKHVLIQYPRCLWAHVNLSVVYRVEQRWDESIKHGQEAISIAPTGIHGRRNLALALIGAGRPREAVTVVRAVIEQNPADPELWRALYLAFTALDDHQNAAAAKANWDQLSSSIESVP